MRTTLAINCFNNAASLYDNYDFSEMCTIGGITLGIKDDGLYRLNHSDEDAGSAISAGFALARTNLASNKKKRIRRLRVLGDAVKKIGATVRSDGERFEDYTFKSGSATCRRKDTSAIMFSFMFHSVDGYRFKVSQIYAAVVAK